MPRNPDGRCALLLLILALLLWLPRLVGPIDLRFDAGVYYILGTSIAEGKGYRLLNEPGEIEAVQYPPLLPAFVAAHQWTLGTGDFLEVGPWLRVSYLLLSVALTAAIYALARLDLPPSRALLAAVISVLPLHIYYLSDLLYTEIPFALVTTLFFLFHRKGERAGWAVLAALMAVAAYLLRTAGIALLGAWVAESLLRRRFKQAAVRAAVALTPVLLWQAHVATVTSTREYQESKYGYQRAPFYYSNVTYAENIRLIDPFRPERGVATPADLARRGAWGLLALPRALGEALTTPVGYVQLPLRELNRAAGREVLPLWLADLPYVVLGLLVIAATIVWAARQEWFVPLYVAMSVSLICLTPWPEQFPRYLTPLTPFLAVMLVGGLRLVSERCTERCAGRWKKAGVVFGMLVMSILLAFQGVSAVATLSRKRDPVRYYDAHGNETVHRLFFYDPPWQALDTALEWVRRRADSDDVIATTVPHYAHLRTGLKAVIPPLVQDPQEAQRLLDSVPVKYVVLDNLSTGLPGLSQRYAAPAVESRPARWKRVYITPGGDAQVYERRK